MKFLKLSVLMFFEYAVWGGYVTTLGVYLLNALHFTPLEVAFVYSFFGLASIFAMPIAGLIADRFLSATYLYALLLMICAICLFILAFTADKTLFFTAFAISSFAYMPTLALSNTIAFTAMEDAGGDRNQKFIAAKTFGTIGFIAAIWLVSYLGFSASNGQFYVAAGAALITAALGLAQKKVPVLKKAPEAKIGYGVALLHIVRSPQMLWIYLMSVGIGAFVQVDNIYSNKFLADLALPNFAFWGSFSQVSGLLIGIGLIFIISAFKIEYLIFIGIFGWVIRFLSLPYVSVDFGGKMALAVSVLGFGIAYKFFTNGATIYVDKYAPPAMRSTAQSLFLMLYNGIGGALGGFLTSYLIRCFGAGDKRIPWPAIWNFYGASAAVILAAAFGFLLFFMRKKV